VGPVPAVTPGPSRLDTATAAAEERDLIVLHYDADFERISALTGQRTHWVVPAGSIE